MTTTLSNPGTSIQIADGNDVQWAANKQYSSRPADQQFANLAALKARVESRRKRAIEFNAALPDISFHATEDGENGDLRILANGEIATPTHWSFGQAASLLGAANGTALLRKLPADLTAKNLNYLVSKADRNGAKFMMVDAENPVDDRVEFWAVTSQEYGRIWDADVVDMTEKVISSDERWFSPWAWGKKTRALFASDRDVFMYFIDGGSIVDAGRDPMGRQRSHNKGIYVWNSEVGKSTFGIASFTFDETCGNFQIWGIREIKLMKIRHTSGGPARFINEAIPALKEYAAASVKPLESAIKAARALLLPTDEKDFANYFLKNKAAKFTAAEIRRAKEAADREEGSSASLFDMVNGFTATARVMAFADARADLEQRAGALMKLVSDDVTA